MSNEEASTSSFKWRHPQEVMQLHQLKKKKKALQARINSNGSPAALNTTSQDSLQDLVTNAKRKNPFLQTSNSKRSKTDVCVDVDVSLDGTLFKIIHCSSVPSGDKNKENITSFSNVLSKANDETSFKCQIDKGKPWIPIDWSLKTKIRFMSPKPLAWGQKLKISEEASGITSFTRCLDVNNSSTLDASPKARFHQCCLYWQQPSLPWLSLFPRTTRKAASSVSSVAANPEIRSSLQGAWSDSLKSLFHLIRTKQCPYFYVCVNHFTVLFRAAGIGGFNDMHALVVPTTRGFRYSLKQEDIDFKMPLKQGRNSDQGCETSDSSSNSTQTNGFIDEEESPDEQWLQSMGIKAEDIKQINYTQARMAHKAECEVDNSEQSLVLIEGLEVQGFYNFLMNCKSAVASVGPLAGIPPTLLAPVAFHGASLNSLKVRESKIHADGENYYSLELSGPILPHALHNLYGIHLPETSLSATFANVNSTVPFSKVKLVINESTTDNCNENGSAVFKKENLSDCGFTSKMLEHFCSDDPAHVSNIECLKYTAESQTYTWS